MLVLWNEMSSYWAASLRALAAAGADIRLVYKTSGANTPYDTSQWSDLDGWSWDGFPNLERLRAEKGWQPDLTLICSWNVSNYVRLGRELADHSLRLLCMDNQWRATLKQTAGLAAFRAVLHRSYDAAFVSGERQATFAGHLGIDRSAIVPGLYCCDGDLFTRHRPAFGRSFLIVARLVEEKGIPDLAEAFRIYRRQVTDPWRLGVAGTGPLASLLADLPGVDVRGFVQPGDLPKLMASAGCLVLPSRFEPWGVVVHEATSAGLPVICTDVCGASTRFVFDGYNGRVVPPGDPDSLAQAMVWVHEQSKARRHAMSAASSALAAQLTTSRWAEFLLDRCREMSELRLLSSR